jgi:hypothetical protein
MKPGRTAASIELQELKMTTVGGLVKEMKEHGGTLGMSGVRGDDQAEATVVCYAVGEDAQLLVDAFLVLQRDVAKAKGYATTQNGELPRGPAGNAPSLTTVERAVLEDWR